MFAPRTELSQEVVGFPDNVRVRKRFVWPYGGRNVFLSGSFTGWSEPIPMSAMEDCPTVFQVVRDLPPGSHQYKFYVDGEWRHDEHEPFIMGTYGIVNTITIAVNLTKEPNPLLTLSGPGKSNSTGNMEVDNEGFQRMVTESDGITQLAALRISEADIMISHRHITEFLSTHMAYDLLPDSGKVIALDVNLPVKQAFHILHEQGISVAPLWDSDKGRFVGVLTALDFILILLELGNHGSNLTEEELETHTISAWKEGKHQIYRQLDKHGRPLQRGIIQAGPCDSLKDVAINILQNKVSTVPIIHSSAQDGSLPQLLHLASLSEILRCICRHYKHSSISLPILQQPICEVPLGTWVPQIRDHRCRRTLAMLRQNSSLSSALSLMVQGEVSSIPIVDGNNALIDTYARSDITALAKDKVYAQIRLDEVSVHQALQLGQDANSSHGNYSQRFQMCLRSDSLQTVMERLATPGVRRVIIVEAGTRRVEGIISLSDVFRFLLG